MSIVKEPKFKEIAPKTTPKPTAKLEQKATPSSEITTQAKAKSTTKFDKDYFKDDFDDRNNKMDALSAMKYLQDQSLFNLYGNTVMNKYDYKEDSIKGIQKVADGARYTFDVDTDRDGVTDTKMSGAEAMADSFDSTLDLYIENKVLKAIDNVKNKNMNYGINIKEGLFSNQVLSELEQAGIKVERLNNRTFVFSLVDDEGNILEDEYGAKGSIIFGDWAIPDGNFSASEQNMSSLLDVMGYDCISRADFIGREEDYFKVLDEVQNGLDNNLYQSSKQTVADIYGHVSGKGLYHSSVSGTSSSHEGNNENSLSPFNDTTYSLYNKNTFENKKLTNKYQSAMIQNKYEELRKEDKSLTKTQAIYKVANIYKLTVSEVKEAIA